MRPPAKVEAATENILAVLKITFNQFLLLGQKVLNFKNDVGQFKPLGGIELMISNGCGTSLIALECRFG